MEKIRGCQKVSVAGNNDVSARAGKDKMSVGDGHHPEKIDNKGL